MQEEYDDFVTDISVRLDSSSHVQICDNLRHVFDGLFAGCLVSKLSVLARPDQNSGMVLGLVYKYHELVVASSVPQTFFSARISCSLVVLPCTSRYNP